MLVETTVLGQVEVDDDDIFDMPEGLYGFGGAGRFALIKKRESETTLMWYQSLDRRVPCFVVFNPFEIIDGYQPELERGDLNALGCKSASELSFLVIAVVPEDITKIIVNLKSPIAVNAKKRLARQVILVNKDYPIQFPLIE